MGYMRRCMYKVKMDFMDSKCLISPPPPRYILCILVFIVSACRLLYSLLSSVLSSPPTSPHPASGTTTHVQLSEAPKSSAKWTIVLAAREGSRERRARSMISWSEMREVIPSVARIMYAWPSPCVPQRNSISNPASSFFFFGYIDAYIETHHQ